MEKTKMTKREVINKMLEDEYVSSIADYKTYLTHELELLDKKKSSAKTDTEENENIAKIAVDVLKKMTTEDKTLFTITEILKNDELSTYKLKNGKLLSASKLTYVLRNEIGKTVVNIKDSKTSRYGLI
jgi:hypothetical protein